MGQHLRILLTEKENEDLAWQSLLYINNLCRGPSIEAFFAEYSKNQQNGKIMFGKKAIQKWYVITQPTSKKSKRRKKGKLENICYVLLTM